MIGSASREGGSFRSALLYGITIFMKTPIKVAPKKRGRPPTGGRHPIVPTRFPADQIMAIDAWAASAGADVTRSEAIRRLVERGLAKGKAR